MFPHNLRKLFARAFYMQEKDISARHTAAQRALLNDMLCIKMKYTEIAPRQSDQKVFVADITKIKSKIGWEPKVSAKDGVYSMIEWVKHI